MRLFLGLFVCSLSVPALAATTGYELNLDLSLNGKHVSSPRVLVKAGQTATVTEKMDTDETFIEVMAVEGQIENNKGILMDFTIGRIGTDGKRTVLSKPHILAMENEQAQVTVAENDHSPETLSLSVVAKRRSFLGE
jgi:type II secretory pathway component GspD/PulD (secretin)